MFEDLDKKIKLDILITFIATVISVNLIVFSYVWNNYATQILSILVIVLPMIYIIGNLIIRGILEREYGERLSELDEAIEEMKQEIEDLREENRFLKNQ